MTDCNIVYHHESGHTLGSPLHAIDHHGTSTVVAYCETHGVRTHDMICPVGRIEQAIEQAIAAIRAELKPTGP